MWVQAYVFGCLRVGLHETPAFTELFLSTRQFSPLKNRTDDTVAMFGQKLVYS